MLYKETPELKIQSKNEHKKHDDFVIIAAKMDTPQTGVALRYETKNWNKMKTKELRRKESHLLRTTTESKDQTMDKNKWQKAKIFSEGTRNSPTTDLWRTCHQLLMFYLPEQTPNTKLANRVMEDHKTNVQSNCSKVTMEVCLEVDPLTIRNEICEILELFLVLHLFIGEISHRTIHTAKHELISLTTLLSADKINDRVVV